MSLVLVNDFISTEGVVVVSRSIQVGEDGRQKIVIQGTYTTTDYIEEIDKIEADGLALNEVYVFEELFTTESKEIIYRFVAEEFKLAREEE